MVVGTFLYNIGVCLHSSTFSYCLDPIGNRSLPAQFHLGGISATVYVADVTIHILRQR